MPVNILLSRSELILRWKDGGGFSELHRLVSKRVPNGEEGKHHLHLKIKKIMLWQLFLSSLICLDLLNAEAILHDLFLIYLEAFYFLTPSSYPWPNFHLGNGLPLQPFFFLLRTERGHRRSGPGKWALKASAFMKEDE